MTTCDSVRKHVTPGLDQDYDKCKTKSLTFLKDNKCKTVFDVMEGMSRQQ